MKKAEKAPRLLSLPGLYLLAYHLRYQAFGTPVPSLKKLGYVRSLSASGSFKESHILLEKFSCFIWTWLPTGQIRGKFRQVPDFVLDEGNKAKSSNSASGGKKKKSVKSTGSKLVSGPKEEAEIKAVKKRCSLPSISLAPSLESESKPPIELNMIIKEETVVKPLIEEESDEEHDSFPEIISIKERSNSVAPTYEPARSNSADNKIERLDLDFKRRMSATLENKADSLELKFANYFNSNETKTVPIRASVGQISVDSIEKKVLDSDLTPPPGFGRRGKSVVFNHQPTPLQTMQPPFQPTTGAYRRPTGTFATKGYIATSEAVFAARASPVPENHPPVEQRAQNFFEQRKKLLENRSAGSSPSPSSALPTSAAPLPKTRHSIQTFAEPALYHPQGEKRSSRFSLRETWLEDELPIRKHVGIVGSHPTSIGQKDEGENFSLFNMDLFQSSLSPFNH